MLKSVIKMKNFIIIFVILKLMCQINCELVSEHQDSLGEENDCELENGIAGKCRLLNECSDAIDSIRNGINPKICGFKGSNPIVCCNVKSGDASRTITRRPHTTTESMISFTEPITARPHNRFNGDHSRPTTSIGSKAKQECLKVSNQDQGSLSYHILGGENAENGEFPHMAALGFQYEDDIQFDCGGSLISDRYVLTAAHCIFRNDDVKIRLVRLGVVNLDTSQHSDFDVETAIVHPEYKGTSHYHDVALLKLAKKVPFSENIHPACLNVDVNIPSRGLVITGWGVTDVLQGEQSKSLQKASLELVSQSICQEAYQGRRGFRLQQGLTDSQMCANYNGNGPRRDACSGDSGGPIQMQPNGSTIWTVVGITSFGVGCGGKIPGVYVRVDSYMKWIENIVWPN